MKPNSKTSTPRSLAICLGLLLLALFVQQSVRADVQTWWGLGASDYWNDTSGNWTNSELNADAPANGDYLVFANNTQTTSSNNFAALSVVGVTFTTGDFDFFGSPFTVTGGITNSQNDNVFDLPVVLSGAQTMEVDGGSLTFDEAITNTGNLTINGSASVTWSNSYAASTPISGLLGSGNLILNGPGSLTINGGFLYPSTTLNFPGNTIVNGGTLNMNAGCFDGNSQIGQSLTIGPGGTVITGAPHIAGASGRPLSIYGGTFTMGTGSTAGEAYFTTVTLSNATLSAGGPNTGDLRGSGSFTNLASAGETIFAVSLNLTSSRIIGVDLGTASPAIDFQGDTSPAIQGSGNLTKVGPGTMAISGVDNHTGNTIISAGTLALTGSMSMNNTPLITVASNAVFDISAGSFSLNTNQILAGVGSVVGTLYDNNAVSGAVSPAGPGAAGTLTMGGLDLSGNGLALNFDLANSTGIGGGTNDLIILTNASSQALQLASGATNTVNINFLNGTPLNNGTYTLIQYPTGYGPSAGSVTTLAAAASRYNYSFTSDGASIKVTVSGAPGNLVWKGDGVTNGWDINTTTNWLLAGAPSVYLAGDDTTFNDIGSNNLPVNLTTALSPTILTVSNNLKNYTLAGVGKITGSSSLVKLGSGNLTLLTTNDFTGPSSINGTGTVTVGNGVVSGGLGSGSLTNNGNVTFFENASFSYAGNMSGTGSLTAFMPGATLSLTGTNSFSGGLVVANGSVQIGANPAIAGSSVSGPITNYSALYFSRSDAFTNHSSIITSAGNTREYGNGDIYIRGGTPASGGMTVDGTGGPISAGGTFNVAENIYGRLTINPGANITVANTMNIGAQTGYSGDVVQNGGTLNVNGYGTVKILSIGLWGSEISTYSMNGGILNVPNAIIDVGSDGIGLMYLTGGTVSCTGLSIDNNGATAAIGGTNSSFVMTGGQLNLGVNGINANGNTAANAIATNHTVVLGGGTIAATAPVGWSTVFNLWLTNGSPTFDTTNATVTLSGGLYGNGGLTKQGIGCLNLNNATNSYSGTTTVAAGTLQGSGTIVGPVVVQSGANISAGATLATGTLTTSNLTVNAGGNVVIDASSTAATSDLLYVKGALTLNSTPLTLNFLGGTPYTGGAYTILSNLPPRTGSLVFNNPTRYAATLDQTQPNRVQVSFTGNNAALVWQGTASSNWNLSDNNWLNNGVLDKYYQSDAVVFDNTGISHSNVSLSAAVTPASVTVDSTGNYTFSGSPIAGVTALTKSGSGTLILLNTNAYTGLTTVAGGTLQVGNGVSSGTLPTNGVVDNYGSIVFNSPVPVNFNGTINGSGSLTQAGSGTLTITATQNHYGGTTINSGSTIQLGNGPEADSGSLGNGPVTNNGAVIFNRAANVSVAAPYTGGGTFTFLGTGYGDQTGYVLNNTNTFTGPVTLSLSRLESGIGAVSLGNPSVIAVNPGSSVYALATPASSIYNIPLTLSGAGWGDGLGALRIEGGGNWAGPITLASNARIGVDSASTNTISGVISGNYELETYGGLATSGLFLAPASGANSFNALRVSIGTAGAITVVGNANAVPQNIPLTMNGGTLQLNGNNQSFTSFLNLSSSSSIQNGSTTSPATVTLTMPLGTSTYSGTFADGASRPLNVTLTQTPGQWTFPMSTAYPNWTGNFTNNGGTIICGLQNSTPFGSQSVVGRTIALNNGAVLNTTLNNVVNGYNGNMVLNNSTWKLDKGNGSGATVYNSFTAAGSLNLVNSTVTGNDSADGSYEMLQLPGTVTVRGTSPSYMVGIGTSSAYDLQSAGTTFDVLHVVGGANSDLIVGGGSSTSFLHSPAATSSGGSLIKINTGILELDGANTYTGPTTISQGTLRLGASATLASASLSIVGGANLDVNALSSGLTLNNNQTIGGSGTVLGSLTDNSGTSIQPGGIGVAGTLTITTNLTLNGAGSLAIDLSNNTGSGNDQIVVGGTLNLSTGTPTPVNFNFLNGAPAFGTPYTLIQCGSITGTAATALTNAAPSRFTTTFSQTATAVLVTFSGAVSNLVWTGSDPLVPLTWDVETSTNWTDGSGGQDVFYALDTVLFNDNPASTVINYTNVTLNVPVNPAAILVNTTNAYTIGGTGAIAGNTSLTMTNTGALILNAANTFAGPVTIQSGKLLVSGTSPLGANLNSITVSNGAALDFNGDAMGSANTRGYTFSVGGSGSDGNGVLRNSGAAIYSYANVSNLTLTADSVVGGTSGRWDIGGMPAGNTVINGNGHNLTKVGSFQMDFRPQYINNLNSFSILNGTVYSDGFSFTNPATANTTVYVLNTNNTTLGISSGLSWNMPLVVSNTTIYNNTGSGSVAWLGNVAVLATNVFNNSGAQVFAGVISGPGAIAIGGGSTTVGTIPGILTFSNANNFAGGLFISSAPVTLTNNTAVSGYAAVVVTSSNALGTGPIVFNLSQMTTNAMTNVARVLECNIQGGGIIPNNIILPSSGTVGLGVTNVGIQGHDSTSVFTLSGQISGGFASLTNWVDFGDASSFGVMRLANPGNSFLGTIYCDRGVLAITGDGCLGNAANTLFLNQGSANGGLRFDAPNVNVAHNIIWNTASTLSVLGDNNGSGIPQTGNNATISGNISSIATGQGLNVGGGTNIAGTCYGSLTLSGSNTFNSQITVNANTKLIAASTNALGGVGYYGIVSSGGTLSLANVGAFVNRQIQFSGPGVLSGGVGVGALENLAGNNVYSAALSLNAPSSFGVTAGSLNLTAGISGAYPLTKVGPGPLTLSATETYSYGTFVNAGTLIVNGSLPVGNAVSVASGATLGGSGTINGPVTTQAGAVLMPGGGLVPGKQVMNSTLNLAGNTVMYLNNSATPATNSQIAGLSDVFYGGALSVTNLGSTANLTNGSRFTLFSALDHEGSFTVTNLPTLSSGLGWSNSLAIDGSIEVVSTENPLPGPIIATFNGTTLTLSWPTNSGWTLQAQTNNLSTGLSNNWVDVPGSASVTSTSIAIDPTKPTVFYRLRP